MAYSYEVTTDTMADCPRNWDNVGTIATWHRRYSMGDVQPTEEPLDWARNIKRQEPGAVIMPVYMYEHGDITVSHTPFWCPWDSGQLGYMYTTLDRYNQIMGTSWRRLSNNRRDIMREQLIHELITYDKYLRGEVYQVAVYDDAGEYIDGESGYYNEAEAIESAKATIARMNAEASACI